MKLKDKVALVTGGSSGLGRATSLRLAQEGALVAVHYGSNEAAAKDVVHFIERNGGTAFALQADVASTDSIRALFAALDSELIARTREAKFDILINSAGINPSADIEHTTEEMFDRVFAINVRGTFFVTQQALPRLRNGGRIINLSSVVSRVAYKDYPAYSASKGAINVLTNVLAADLGSRGITVNSLSPGPIEGEMNAGITADRRAMIERNTALGRFGQPTDISSVAAFLASADSSFVTAQYIEASGGLRI